MKIAIMQPYLFPYIGYWQLISAVDKFIILDDVNYIKGGWVNRNRILISGKDHYFTLPLKDASPNRLINEIYLNDSSRWSKKFFRSLEMEYKKSPHFEDVYRIIKECICFECKTLSSYITNSIKKICAFLEISTEIVETSIVYATGALRKSDRIIAICKEEKATEYVNAIGGTALYDKEKFLENGIALKFLNPNDIIYNQPADKFVSNLSIIDILFRCEKDEVKHFLQCYSLL